MARGLAPHRPLAELLAAASPGALPDLHGALGRALCASSVVGMAQNETRTWDAGVGLVPFARLPFTKYQARGNWAPGSIISIIVSPLVG